MTSEHPQSEEIPDIPYLKYYEDDATIWWREEDDKRFEKWKMEIRTRVDVSCLSPFHH
jgi:hypothetical protein